MHIRLYIIIAGILLPGLLTAQKYELVDTKYDHASSIEAIALAPDGKTMISGDHSGFLLFWDLPTMKVIYKVRAHYDVINTILFDHSGTRFVTSGEDQKIKVWEFPSFKMVSSYTTVPDNNVFAVISPDDQYIYYGGTNHNRTYNSNTGGYNEPYGGLYRVPLSGGKSTLVWAGGEGQGYTTGHNITDGNLDYDGTHVVFTKDNFIYFWSLDENRLDYKVESMYGLNNFTCTKDAVYCWGTGRIIVLKKNDSGRFEINRYVEGGRLSEMYYSKLVFSDNGKLLVTGDDGHRVNIWDATTLENKQTLLGHADVIRTFLFWNQDSTLITGGYDGQMRVWSIPRPKEEEPKDTIQEPVDVVFTENNIPLTIKDRPVTKAGTFYVKTEEFEIEIWDNSVYDHDIISLNINGEWVLENYEVTKEKYRVKIKIKPNTNNYLILYAHNLGEISPNTAAVGLVVGDKLQRLTVSSDLKQCGALNFEFQP